MSKLDKGKLLQEVKFNFSRSGGKGGQNVNKVETKAELVFNVEDSDVLTEAQKNRIKTKIKTKIDKEGNLRLVAQSERYQLANRKSVTEKFLKLVENALKKEKVRIKTYPSSKSERKRLVIKRKHSEKKKQRRIELGDY